MKQEESSAVDSRPIYYTAGVTASSTANETNREDKTETLVERLAVRVVDADDEKVERHREDMKRRSEKSCRGRTRGNALLRKHRKCFILDMTSSRSCRHSLCVSFILWTSVLLLFLAKGCTSEERGRFDRFQKYDHESEVQGYASPEAQNTYKVIHFLRELIQKQQQQQQNQQHRTNQQQLQMYNNGEDLSENQIDWRKVPLPILYQIRAMMNKDDENSKEEDKRGSYMALCHFKICNLG